MIAFLWVVFASLMAAGTALLIIDTRRMKEKSIRSLAEFDKTMKQATETHAAYVAAVQMVHAGNRVTSIGPGFVMVADDDGSTHKVWLH